MSQVVSGTVLSSMRDDARPTATGSSVSGPDVRRWSDASR
ncbi:hypothetical protein SERN_2754 [Serinibacter arcticus]|uniref:Uncharacterized protein n=1 Tax=Serinibacter arcticus TaxID=1655435 RepID=A0A4Z1E106_9MICO|nr:hypothetical protein SERN_2754 [Serinibacter arcticus]